MAIIYPSKALSLRVTLPPSLLSYGASQSSALMALESEVSPYSISLPRASTQVSSRPFHHRVWSGLSGRDRPWIGWKRSAYAIVFSSCQSSLRLTDICATPEYSTHLSQCRAQYFGHLHSSCLGIPLPRMDTWAHLCTYVMILRRPSLRSLNIPFQSLSSLLSRSKRRLIGAESSLQCTVVQTWAT